MARVPFMGRGIHGKHDQLTIDAVDTLSLLLTNEAASPSCRDARR
jgi:hypothetical protein